MRRNFHGNPFLDLAHFLGAQLGDPNCHGVFFPFCVHRDQRVRRYFVFRGGKIPTGGRQARTHHVRPCKQETYRTPVYPHFGQQEGIYADALEQRSTRGGFDLHLCRSRRVG